MFRNARNRVSESSKFQACWEHPEKVCYPSICVIKFRTYVYCIFLQQLSEAMNNEPFIKMFGVLKE